MLYIRRLSNICHDNKHISTDFARPSIIFVVKAMGAKLASGPMIMRDLITFSGGENMFLKKALLFSLMVMLSVSVLKSTESNAKTKTQISESNPCTFFPRNNLRFSVSFAGGQMTEADFNSILSLVEKIYAPIFEKYGFGLFNVERRWTDDTVNAMADIGLATDPKTGKQTQARRIHMFGGLARHPLMTKEGFLLVACHEIGHHLGGYPRSDQSWASDEGESDYYSTSKCARLILGQIPSIQGWQQAHISEVDPLLSAQCNFSFPNNQVQSAMCMRSSIAGLSLARVLGSLHGNANQNFNTPDRTVVAKTYDGHPEAQCRLDTYFQAALCQKSELERMGSGPGMGACESPARGGRPACWYKATTPASIRH